MDSDGMKAGDAPPWATGAALVLLVGLALPLRFWGLDWDGGFLFHPDERNLVEAAARIGLDEIRDPGFHAYGGLPLFVDRGVAEVVARWNGEPERAADPALLARVGRHISAGLSALTILLLYALGREVGGARVGVVAAALLALAPGAIQAAHYATTESWLLLFGVALAWICAEIVRARELRVRHALLLATVGGLALGTKMSALAYVAMPITALALRLRRDPVRAPASGLVALVLALAIAAAVSPHSVVYREAFLASMAGERAVATGALPVFYTLSFRGTLPWLHPLGTLHWLSGPLVPLLGSAGLALVVWRARRMPERALLPLAVFAVLYFAYVGGWHAKFARYYLLLLPALALGAALLCEALPRLGPALRATTVASTGVFGLALFGVYLQADTRLVASDWIAREAAPGALVVSEARDIVLPALRRESRAGLRSVFMDGFAEDTGLELRLKSELLAEADWAVFTSRRVHAVVRANPDLYPRTSALYRLLLDGGLGYVEEARFRSPPCVAGFCLPEEAGEETLRVFDHPTVRILRNRERLAPGEIRRRVMVASGSETS